MKNGSTKTLKKYGKKNPVPAGKFKAQCLELMDEVRDRHCEIVITKHGKPVAKLVPIDRKRPDIFGCMKGTVTILGDIVGSMGEIWDADA